MYFERLTFLAFIKSLSYILSENGSEKDKIELFYFEASKICVAFINVISLLFSISFKRMDFKFGEITDGNGTNMGYKIYFEDLEVALQEILNSNEYSNLLPDDIDNGCVSAFIKKNTGTTISTGERFETKSLWEILLMIQVVSQHMRNECQKENSILFIERRCWMSAIVSYSRPLGISIVQIKCILNLKPTFSSIKERLRGNPTVSKIVHYKKIRSIPGLLSMVKLGKYRNGKHVKIIVDSILSKYTASSFWSQSALLPENVLFAVSESCQINKGMREDVQNAGMDIVALKPLVSGSSEIPMYLPCVDKKETFDGYTGRFYHSRKRRFIKFQLNRYHYLKSYWLDVFRTCKAKVYISNYKYSDKHIASTAAINELGGIAAIWQESYSEFSSPEGLIKADLVFGFSPAVSDVEQGNGSQVRYFVTIGYIGDYRFDLVRSKAQELRSSLKENGARKIIAFLDEMTVDDERWGPGHSSTREDYRFILEKVLSEPWLGVILKPKKSGTLRRRLGPVSEILEQAIETGRCYLFDQDYITTPAEAAMASDITIHDSLWAGTAGLEAALAGTPTLMLDRYGWHRSRIYKLGEKSVVFLEWQHLWEALMEHWNKRKIPGFGDWSPIIDEFDPFRDGKAAHRMGTYLHWLIQGYEKGQDREVILADAAEKYCKRWGRDKVVQMP